MRSPFGGLVVIGVCTVALIVGCAQQMSVTASGLTLSPDKDYVAVFSKTNTPFAVIEKPKGFPIGPGTQVEVDAFGLRIVEGDPAILPFLQRQAMWVGDDRAKLPPGFAIYTNPNLVRVNLAASTGKCRLQFIDPSEIVGQGGNSKH